mgnify:CR=1 FL=1
MTAEASPDATPELFDKIVNLTKRRGFVYPSAEIYGGFRSTYDYGPIGVLLLRNVKDAWWRSMVQLREDVVGLDASILSPPQVWEASGHLANFTDPLVDCTKCNNRWRLDKLDDPDLCPNCGARGAFTEPRQFNLMFKTQAGPVEDAAAVAYRHEIGNTYGGGSVYAETGPISLGAGDQVMCVTEMIPDERTQGDVTATFKTRFHPNDIEREYGPYSMTNPTSIRFTGRQIRMRVDGNALSDWRVGVMRIDAVPGGRR